MEKDGQIRETELAAAGGFVARYTHKFDSKKRLTIPVEWREVAGKPPALYVIPGLNKDVCLYVYPAREILPRLQKFRGIRFGDSKARAFARMLASRSQMVSWDGLGRIRIKDELLNHAQLEDEVEMIAAFDHFELWNPKQWQRAGAADKTGMEEALRYIDF